MKSIILKIILVMLIGTINVSAQITLPNDRPLPDPFENMSLRTIKQGIKKNLSFSMTGAATILEVPQRSEDPGLAKTLYFRPFRVLFRDGSDYIQVNSFLNDAANSSPSGDQFRIYIHQIRNTVGLIDKNKIKVNWKGSFGERNIALQNVKVVYKPHGILISGTYSRSGYELAMSFTIIRVLGIL